MHSNEVCRRITDLTLSDTLAWKFLQSSFPITPWYSG